MSVKMRQIVEREISTAVVDALLGAGYSLSVDNEDEQTEYSTDRETILNWMYQTDVERVYAKNTDGVAFAWVYFVYGNDGWDVISDYTVNLESLIGGGTDVEKIVDKYAD
jgi:hypothetical protein